MIHSLPRSAFGAARSTPPFWAIVTGFWLFTFSVLSWRTGLVLGDSFHLFTARRMLSTIAGAGLFAFVLRNMMSPTANWAQVPACVLAAILPAALIILCFRLALDWTVFPEPLPIEHNLRWVITWAGYFGLWISGALAFGLHRNAVQAPALTHLSPRVRAAEPERPAPAEANPEAWLWLVDVLAEELARQPLTDRAVVAQALIARAGYEIADDPAGQAADHNMRVRLAHLLACRLSERR